MPYLNFVSAEAGADAFQANAGYVEYGSDKISAVGSFPFRVDGSGNITARSLATSAANSAAGTLTVTGGNVDIATAGNGLAVAEGSNAKQGTAVLNGTTAVVVANTSVTANSRIFLTINTPGGTPASPYVSARSAGTSFSIKSTGASDTSTVAYLITEPG
jgi:hypothetical protein